MKTELHTPTIHEAKNVTAKLVRAYPAIEAVLLCGSVARGDANPWSDIDLVVVGSDPKLTLAELRQQISEQDHVSLIYYRTPAFEALHRHRPLFVAHLRKEGVVLFDSAGVLRRLMDSPTTPVTKAAVADEIKMYRSKLAPYKHPRRYNNNFLFCLSHLYSIGKGVIMLGLANRGELEFNRDAAFGRFEALNPDLAEQVAKVRRLRPFYRLVSGREPEPLPFSYSDAAIEMEDAVNAIESLTERATCP
jgi:predicted nucleotidyltransferase